MIRTAFLTVALLGSTVLPAQALAQAAPAEQQIAQLNLSATGEVRISPDQAQVSAGVVTEARTAADALRANSQRMQAVFAALGDIREPLNKSWHICLAHEIAQLGVTNLAHSPRYGLRFVP